MKLNLRERLEQLEPREQKLLAALMAIFVVMVVLLIPVLVSAAVSGRRDHNEQLRAAINAVHGSKDKILEAEEEVRRLEQRYGKPAPALAGFLDKLATESGVDIPESQDSAPVPHGKTFEERSTKLTIRKMGMLNFVTFMEKIENSGYPISITGLNIRKRATEPDSFDMNVTVSAYHRKEAEKKAAADSEEDD